MIFSSDLRSGRGFRGSDLPQLFLFGFPLATIVGPRIAVPGFDQGDFRLQDVLALGACILLIVNDLRSFPRGTPGKASIALWVLLTGAAILIVFSGIANSPPLVTFYSLRLLEVPVIALLIYRLLLLSGAEGFRASLFGIGLGLSANLVWVATQLLSGSSGALWSLGSVAVEQYGVGLLGEEAAFPAGQTLFILLAGVLSGYILGSSGNSSRGLLLGVAATGLFGAVWFTQSRISIFSAALLFAIFLVVALVRIGRRSVAMAGGVASLTIVVVLALLGQGSRFSLNDLIIAFEYRLFSLYIPILELVEGDFFLGLGPGVGRNIFGYEYHSLYSALLADFGFFGLLVFCFAAFMLLRKALKSATNGPLFWERVFANWTVLIILNLLVAGLVQSSHIAATPSHLAAIVVATFLWLNLRVSPAQTRRSELVSEHRSEHFRGPRAPASKE